MLLQGVVEMVACIVFFSALSIILIIGDKLILCALGARRLDERSLIAERIKNISYRKSFPSIGLYVLPKRCGNLLVVETLFGRPLLLVGRGIEEDLSAEELDMLLIFALRKVESRDALFNTLFVLGISLFAFPLLSSDRGRFGRGFSLLVINLLSPLFFLHGKIAQRFDYRYEDLAKDDGIDLRFLDAAWAKIAPMEVAPSPLGRTLVGFLCVSKRKPYGNIFMESLLGV